MALIDEKTRTFLQKKLAEDMVRPVNVEVFKGKENPETTGFAIDLLKELAEINPSIRYEVKELDGEAAKLGVEASPTLLIGRELGYRLEYWGAPLGLEAEGFIDTLVMVSQGKSGLSGAGDQLLGLLGDELRLYSFVTPSCPYCPKSVMLNHRLAIAVPGKVRSIAVEAQQNMELARKYRVSSVPQQLFNEDTKTTSVGVQPEKGYIRSVLSYAGVEARAIEALEQEQKKSMLDLPVRPDHPVAVTDETFGDAIRKYPFVVVDCWAEWCGPCRMVAPVVDALAQEMAGQVVFAKLDTEENQGISAEYQIHSIPTLLVFRDGKLVERLVGFKPKPALKKEIEKLMQAAA